MTLPLSADYLNFDSKQNFKKIYIGSYLIDNGEFLYLIIFDKIKSEFYSEIFDSNDYKEAEYIGIEGLDYHKTTPLNIELIQLINFLRKQNKGKIQPLKIMFLT